MLEIYRKLYDILDPRERRLTVVVFGVFLLVALVEAVGVASIMPFMAVLSNPGVVETNQYLAWLYDGLGFQSTDAFLFFLGVVFLVVIIGTLAFRAFAFWVQIRFSQKRNHVWACRMVEKHLGQHYEWFMAQHSGALGSSVLNEVNRAVNGAFFPALQFISQALVALFLVALLVAVDPVLAFSVALILGSAYAALFLSIRRYLGRVGHDMQAANRERFKVIQEMFGGVKDVKVYGLEAAFLNRFFGPSLKFAQRQITARLFGEIPAFGMQALVFGGMMVVLLYLYSTWGGLDAALPVFSLFALAGYRLMPALQAMYKHLSEMRVNAAVLDAVHSGMCGNGPGTSRTGLSYRDGSVVEPIGLRDRLRLEAVTYSYPNADRVALDAVTLEIPARSTVGLVGSTGAGKTTIVDLILGLLEPDAGELVVDGRPVTPELRQAWQRSIGYVPQHIFLADDTISANIAFGLPAEKIDRKAVERAARIANLHSFVVNELARGYETPVGERGVRLSGGQRQRIGIARALYRDPDVLILDEATSALDNLTEQAVMEAVHNLGNRKTIILIAHRLSTVQECDQIFFMEAGQVMARGTYAQLVEDNPQFRRLAGGSAS